MEIINRLRRYVNNWTILGRSSNLLEDIASDHEKCEMQEKDQAEKDRESGGYFTNPSNFQKVQYQSLSPGYRYVVPLKDQDVLKRKIIHFGGGYFLLDAIKDFDHPTRTSGTRVLGTVEGLEPTADVNSHIEGNHIQRNEILKDQETLRIFERVAKDNGFIRPFTYDIGIAYGVLKT